MSISEGKPRGDVMDALYSQLGMVEKDLVDDDEALKWFDLTTPALPSTPLSIPQLTPLPVVTAIPIILKEGFQG